MYYLTVWLLFIYVKRKKTFRFVVCLIVKFYICSEMNKTVV